MMELLSNPETWVSLLALSVMEIVLGIDNVVFITILCGRLPEEKQLAARRLGLTIALLMRLALLSVISLLMRLTSPLFGVFGAVITGKGLILMAGGLFLLWKATHEIYLNVEKPEGHGPDQHPEGTRRAASERDQKRQVRRILVQVALIDVVFSLDSVITAVGMAQSITVMVVAMLIAVGVMVAFAGPIGDFVQRHPSVRILALAFLVLIGVMLLIEGTGGHVSKGYVYSAMAFSLLVEMLNLRRKTKVSRVPGPREEAAAQ